MSLDRHRRELQFDWLAEANNSGAVIVIFYDSCIFYITSICRLIVGCFVLFVMFMNAGCLTMNVSCSQVSQSQQDYLIKKVQL